MSDGLKTHRYRCEALAAWFGTDLGNLVLEAEKARIAAAMNQAFGVRQLEIGLCGDLSVTPPQQEWHRMLAVPVWDRSLGRCEDVGPLVCRPEELPFGDDALDAVVLHHTLDLAEYPHSALRESARVVRPGGCLVVVGFNPIGFWGMRRLFSTRRRMPWNARFMLCRRVHDWLSLLNFAVSTSRYGFLRPPTYNRRLLSRLEFMEPLASVGTQVPLGAFYCVSAFKEEKGMIGLRPEWATRKVVPIPVGGRSTTMPGLNGRSRPARRHRHRSEEEGSNNE